MKVASIELLTADDVLKGNAGDAVVEAVFQGLELRLPSATDRRGCKGIRDRRKGVGEQNFGSQSGIRDAVEFETLGRLMQRFANGHATSSFLRRSAWK